MTSQKFAFQNGTSHCDLIFTPGIEQNSRKITFMPENIFPGTDLYPPLHSHGSEAKQKNSYVQFYEMSHFKNNCSNPPGESILLKFCQNVSDR